MNYSDFIKNNLKDELNMYSENEVDVIIEYLKRKNYMYSIVYGINDEKRKNKLISHLKSDLNNLKKYPKEELYSIVMPDNNYEEFKNLSNQIFAEALKKANSGSNYILDKNNLKAINDRVLGLYEGMTKYNQEISKMTLSDTLLDIQYLGGSNIMSLRVGENIRK